jgi:LysM repeat protein
MMTRRTLLLISVLLLLLLLIFLLWWFFIRDSDGGGATAPNAVDDVFVTLASEALSKNVIDNDSDPDGGVLTVTETTVSEPANGVLVLASDGSFTYTPNDGVLGDDTFEYEVCNEQSACSQAMVTISVLEAPAAVDDAFTTGVNTAVSGNVLDNDAPSGGLTANTTLLASPDSGSAELQESGAFTYTPEADFTGEVSLTYEACLTVASEFCDDAIVSITVGDVDGNGDGNGDGDGDGDGNGDGDGDGDGNGDGDGDGDGNGDGNGDGDGDGDGDGNGDGDGDGDGNDDGDGDGDGNGDGDGDGDDNGDGDGNGDGDSETVTHTVVQGEWIIQIARCYGTSAQAILLANRIYNPDLIYPGQELKIPNVGSEGTNQGTPCVKTYHVKSGDTPASIAEDFGMNQSEFMRVNAIPWPNGFYVGQFIVIPRPIPDYMLP